jgi:alkylated DNA repair dioxygenase AlkB
MDLFNTEPKETINLLPYDGIVNYYGQILAAGKANQYFNELLSEVAWKNDEAIIYGKLITTKRKVAWYGDEAYRYSYSNITKTALPWTANLLEIKTIIEEKRERILTLVC